MRALRFLATVLATGLALLVPANGEHAPLQGSALLKSDILGVFAHPDDETGMAASLAHYAHAEKKVVAHAYITRGEGGGNMVGTQAGAALGVLREAELRDALRILGVRYVYFLDQQDFFYTESLGATLRKWRKEDALERLVRLVRSLRPEVLVTMNPAPNPGQHGHHQAAGVLATEAFTAAADPDRFPAQLSDEGLAVWQPRKLFYGGATGGWVTTITTTRPLADGRIPADIAGEALSHHRSQAFGGFVRSPWLRRPQNFSLVKSVVAPISDATDLFSGLPAGESARPVTLVPDPPSPPMAFVPRPAIANFRRWAEEQGLGHLGQGFLTDLPVVAGEPNELTLEARRAGGPEKLESVRFEAPDGWQVRPEIRGKSSSLDPLRAMTVIVVPPAGATTSDIEVHAVAATDSGPVRATARLHPIPSGRVPKVRSFGVFDIMRPFGAEFASWSIGTNLVWQGTVAGPDDCSATVRVAHDGKGLLVEVDVRDDVVVSNIQPDDIKGHWRSDSVEICLDPAAGAEDTTGCFKVGIFPFDTSGKVRAARDADARQGPVEQTAPGLRLGSSRTPDGYRIRALVPFELVTGHARAPKKLGFNVLIYDGDKPDAAPGENINECRLAWAPRSGVQGRPEDWGRIHLE